MVDEDAGRRRTSSRHQHESPCSQDDIRNGRRTPARGKFPSGCEGPLGTNGTLPGAYRGTLSQNQDSAASMRTDYRVLLGGLPVSLDWELGESLLIDFASQDRSNMDRISGFLSRRRQ